MFDPILKRFATGFGCVDLQYETALVAFEDKGDRVEATVRDVRSGQTRTVTADYLIGTDGGASTVREAAGISMSGKPALTYTTNVLFRCADFPSLHRMGKAYRFIFIGPEGTWLTIVAIDGGDRFRMSIVGTPDKVNHSEADICAALVRAMGKEFDFEILSVLRWVRRELVADRYGRGRVFIAGDAAHLMSPTGALGMNTGIQDSVDLGWKLEAVLRGWGGAHLLASYESERRPVALRNVAASTENLDRMLSPRDRRPPPQQLLEAGARADAIRAEYGKWFTETMRHEWFMNGFHLGYRYDDSPIVWPDGTPAPALETSTYTQTARPGARAPHVALPDGRSTLDLFGRGFTLLRLGGDAPSGEGLMAAAATARMPIRSVTLDDAKVRRAYAAALVLVRPDGHVAFRDDTEPAEPGVVIDLVRGAKALAGAGRARLEVAS